MIPQQWTSPCGNNCTHKFAALTQIPWRVFCKKGCDTDGDSWEDCLNDCDEICYKDPVIKDHQWSAYIDRSPGQDDNSAFNVSNETVNGVHSKRPPKPEIVKKPHCVPAMEIPATDDVTATSA